MASHRGVPIPDPKWYPRNYPLLTIIKACNYWMPAMTEVFERWTEIGELVCDERLQGLSFCLLYVLIAGFVEQEFVL